jgi:hypothetical protein
MDFTLYGIPGVSLKNTISANLRYFIQKDEWKKNIKTLLTGLLNLSDECPLFQFTTGHMEEFDRPFYTPWKCCTSIFPLKGNNQSLSFLAVTMELDPHSQVVLDAQCAQPGCLRFPYPTFLQGYDLPGSLWEIQKQPNGIIQFEDGQNLNTDPSPSVCLLH